MGTIAKVTAGGGTHYVASTSYCYCDTAANTVAKVAKVIGDQADSASTAAFTLIKGTTVHVKFVYSNTAANPTLAVGGTTAAAIKKYGTTAVGNNTKTSWEAGAIVSLTYDGTNWVMNSGWDNNDDTKSFTITAATGNATTDKVYLTGTNGSNKVTYTATHNTSGVTAGSYGPTADVTGNNNNTIKVPQITVDNMGHVTAVTERTLTCKNTQNTYTNAALGQGYATCDTAAATAAKVGTLSNYVLSDGGIVAVKFTYAVPANATLNINSKGAKSIYYNGAAITANVIEAGDIATFVYSTYYHLIAIDRAPSSTTPSAIGAAAIGSSRTYARADHVHNIVTATGDSNGQVKIAGANVSVKGLGTAAYTASTAYAAATHSHTTTFSTSSATVSTGTTLSNNANLVQASISQGVLSFTPKTVSASNSGTKSCLTGITSIT